MLKGLFAGAANLLLAAISHSPLPALSSVAGAMAVGFAGYGVSLVLYVLALRELGAVGPVRIFRRALHRGGDRDCLFGARSL